ncbi:MAG: flagellar protein FlaG [Lachnospiraceae bacterium]|nr:flagellar protein FlaG [Lachnospiraceae bacterium]
MAIEPLGSVMTVQAQPVQPKPAVTAAKQPAEYTDNNKVPENVRVDESTAVVENASQKGKSESEKNNQQNSGQQMSNEQIKKAVEQLNKKLSNAEAVFGIHDDTHRVTIKIVDKDTKEVIKELPPEKTLDMIAKVWELAGILIDERR